MKFTAISSGKCRRVMATECGFSAFPTARPFSLASRPNVKPIDQRLPCFGVLQMTKSAATRCDQISPTATLGSELRDDQFRSELDLHGIGVMSAFPFMASSCRYSVQYGDGREGNW